MPFVLRGWGWELCVIWQMMRDEGVAVVQQLPYKQIDKMVLVLKSLTSPQTDVDHFGGDKSLTSALQTDGKNGVGIRSMTAALQREGKSKVGVQSPITALQTDG